MNCDEVNELLVEYLLRELPEEQTIAIDSHLRQGCARCLEYEMQVSKGMDLMFKALPSEYLSLEQRDTILAAATDRERSFQTRVVPSIEIQDLRGTTHWSSILPFLLATAAGIFVMMVITPIRKVPLPSTSMPRDSISLKTDTLAPDPMNITDNTELADKKHAAPRLVSMQPTNLASRIEGRILWDELSHEIHFFGNGIPAPPAGMRYVLWLIGDQDQTLASKELKVGVDGHCKATASAWMGEIERVSITLESTVSRFERPSKNVELTLDAKRLRSPL